MSSTSDAADVADASRADAVRADAVRAAAESRAIVAAGLGGLIGGLIVFAGRLVGLADGCRVPSSRPARCSSPEWC